MPSTQTHLLVLVPLLVFLLAGACCFPVGRKRWTAVFELLILLSIVVGRWPAIFAGRLNNPDESQIIAGAANNQLSEPHDGQLLHRMGVLYAPDYVINSGGLIHASGKYYGASDKIISEKIDHIYDALLTIFQRSQQSQCATSDIADQLAEELLTQDPEPWKK